MEEHRWATEEIWNKRETQNMRESCGEWKITRDFKKSIRVDFTCWKEIFFQKSNFFPPLFLLFSSPWPFSIHCYSSKMECHFSFSHCQHPSALLSETSAIISLSYYRSNGGAFIQSLTFRERCVTFIEAQLYAFSSTNSRIEQERTKEELTREQEDCLNFQKTSNSGCISADMLSYIFRVAFSEWKYPTL